MPKLTEVLKKKQDMLNAAHSLGFNDLRLCASATDGFLGIYGTFDKQQSYQDDWNARCMALSYILGEITQCKVAVISDKDDLDHSVRKQKTIDLSEVSTDNFTKLFSRPAIELNFDEIDPEDLSYKESMKRRKDLYYEFIPSTEGDNKNSKDSTDDKQPTPDQQSIGGSPKQEITKDPIASFVQTKTNGTKRKC